MGPRTRTGTGRRARRPSRRHGSGDRWLLLIMLVCGMAALLGLLISRGIQDDPRRDAPAPTMAQARAANAAVPIQRRRRVPAAPFRFRGGPAERAQAVDCLATAALYEVGNDRRGQRAVIQVVLNRVRAGGFPGTICGVVYQGFARATGCQFSFTCDGSFGRRPIRRGWAQARRAGRRALAGHVFADVGGATHYHADWIVPYWRDSLVKVGRVGTHLFYVRR